jgi:hypothetical protein
MREDNKPPLVTLNIRASEVALEAVGGDNVRLISEAPPAEPDPRV